MRPLGEWWRASRRPLSPRGYLVFLALWLILIGFTVHRLVAGHRGAVLSLIAELLFLTVLMLGYRNTRRQGMRRP
jgi:hypothetical protein